MQPKKINTYQRGRLLAIAALALVVFKPSARGWRIIRRSAERRCLNPEKQLELLMLEAVAPSSECAAPAWYWALTRERDCAAIIRARLVGYMPSELIEDAAKAAAAVIHGGTVAIKYRPKAEAHARQNEAITDLKREAITDGR